MELLRHSKSTECSKGMKRSIKKATLKTHTHAAYLLLLFLLFSLFDTVFILNAWIQFVSGIRCLCVTNCVCLRECACGGWAVVFVAIYNVPFSFCLFRRTSGLRFPPSAFSFIHSQTEKSRHHCSTLAVPVGECVWDALNYSKSIEQQRGIGRGRVRL